MVCIFDFTLLGLTVRFQNHPLSPPPHMLGAKMSGDLFSTDTECALASRCRRRRRRSGPVLFTCNSILRLEFTRKRRERKRGYDNQILANDSEEENVHICLQLMIRSLLLSLLSPSTLLSVPLLSALPLARSETLNVGGI